MKRFFFTLMIKFCNTRGFNWALRRLSQSRLSRRLIPAYIRKFRIDTAEIKAELGDFASLNAFFIRELRAGARPIDEREQVIISPVDCCVELSSSLTLDAVFQVKGQQLGLTELLGAPEKAEPFAGGHIFVLYLSPADYHRIHAPFTGQVVTRYALGKKSWPVNQQGLKFGPRPLCSNYRVINQLENGAYAVFVGATNVNSIICHASEQWDKSAEVGYFQFGSTVVLLFKEGQIKPLAKSGERKRMGEAIAEFV